MSIDPPDPDDLITYSIIYNIKARLKHFLRSLRPVCVNFKFKFQRFLSEFLLKISMVIAIKCLRSRSTHANRFHKYLRTRHKKKFQKKTGVSEDVDTENSHSDKMSNHSGIADNDGIIRPSTRMTDSKGSPCCRCCRRQNTAKKWNPSFSFTDMREQQKSTLVYVLGIICIITCFIFLTRNGIRYFSTVSNLWSSDDDNFSNFNHQNDDDFESFLSSAELEWFPFPLFGDIKLREYLFWLSEILGIKNIKPPPELIRVNDKIVTDAVTNESTVSENSTSSLAWFYHAHIKEKKFDNIKSFESITSEKCRPLSNEEIVSLTVESAEKYSRNISDDLTLLIDMLCYVAEQKMTKDRKEDSRTEIAIPKLINVTGLSVALNDPSDIIDITQSTSESESNEFSSKWWYNYNPPNLCMMAVYMADSEENKETKSDDPVKNNMLYKIDQPTGEQMIISNQMQKIKDIFIHSTMEIHTNYGRRFEEITSHTNLSRNKPKNGRCSILINPKNFESEKIQNSENNIEQLEVNYKVPFLPLSIEKQRFKIEKNFKLTYQTSKLSPQYTYGSNENHSDVAKRYTYKPTSVSNSVRTQLYLQWLHGFDHTPESTKN